MFLLPKIPQSQFQLFFTTSSPLPPPGAGSRARHSSPVSLLDQTAGWGGGGGADVGGVGPLLTTPLLETQVAGRGAAPKERDLWPW